MLNQEKIGKFISERRKDRNMTQKQLAEKLNISDKAISKWETGKSLPDNAILLELCELLQVNVNELLSGEKLSQDSYHGKAEKNMMNLMERSEKAERMNRRTWLSMMIGAGVLLAALCSVIWISTNGDVVWFFDTVSLLFILVLSLAVLLAAGLIPDFFKGLYLCLGKRRDAADEEILRSLTACKLVLLVAPMAGVVATVIGLMAIFLQQLDQSLLAPNLAVAILSTIYGIVIDLLILPVAGRLRVMIK